MDEVDISTPTFCQLRKTLILEQKRRTRVIDLISVIIPHHTWNFNVSGKMFKGLSFSRKKMVPTRRWWTSSQTSFHHANRVGLKTQSNHIQQQVYTIFSVLLSVHY